MTIDRELSVMMEEAPFVVECGRVKAAVAVRQRVARVGQAIEAGLGPVSDWQHQVAQTGTNPLWNVRASGYRATAEQI